MAQNPNLNVLLTEVMRPDIALILQTMDIYSVETFLQSWGLAKNHRSLEKAFDSPRQARQAVSVLASWVIENLSSAKNPGPIEPWWSEGPMQ